MVFFETMIAKEIDVFFFLTIYIKKKKKRVKINCSNCQHKKVCFKILSAYLMS